MAGAVYTITTDLNNQIQGSTNKRFILKDHLGSPDVITDANGIIRESLSFDPWGHRRHIATDELLTQLELLNFDTNTTNRGFTGHEHVDELGLIHMNGRVYDPKLGRFLQADPFIQAASNTQNYNRYSYGYNSPLNGTDPSGYFWNFVAFAFFSYAVGDMARRMDIPVLSAIAGIAGCSGGDFSACSTAVFAATYGYTHDFYEAAFAAGTALTSASVFSAIGKAFTDVGGFFAKNGWGHIGTHAMVGGIMNVVQGGKFGHGFISAGFTKAIRINDRVAPGDASAGADTARVVVAGIVGGTISKITGGKFANGAITAAFAQAFNGNGAIQREADAWAAQYTQNLYDALNKVGDFFSKIWKGATGWHFEGRDAHNAPFESLSLDQVANNEGWSEMSGVQASAHQAPETANLERKFIHKSSGAELVFNGDTGALLTNPAYKGTYNYVNAVAWKDVNGLGSFGGFLLNGSGHFVVDYVPWVFGGNVRGAE